MHQLSQSHLYSLMVESIYLGPSHLKFSNIPGVLGYISGLKDKASNYVGFVVNPPLNATTVIKETINELDKRGLPYCWIYENERELEVADFLEQIGARKEYIL